MCCHGCDFVLLLSSKVRKGPRFARKVTGSPIPDPRKILLGAQQAGDDRLMEL